MSFFDRLLGKRPDPTQGWGSFQSPAPSFDLTEMSFGSLKFGDEISTAAFLGRPTKVQWGNTDYFALLYAIGGFQIDFEHGKFTYLAFLIGPDESIPSKTEITYIEPRLRKNGTDCGRLTGNSSVEELKKLFGPPTNTDEDEVEIVLNFLRDGFTLEFEFNSKRRLKRWNIFPTVAYS